MKPKLVLCSALALSGCFYFQTAQAYWATIQISRTNITTIAPFLRIIPTSFGLTNNPMTEFSVFVLLKDSGNAELVSGSLTVKDGQETNAGPYLVSTQVQAKELLNGSVPKEIPKSWAGKCRVFRFEIATRLLAHSVFRVEYTIDPKFGTAGTAYVFTLKEFADGK
jgi:hypothetical protein